MSFSKLTSGSITQYIETLVAENSHSKLLDSSLDSPSLPEDVGQIILSQKELNSVLIPRWVVYFQAALLGVVATTFFIFGLMVGSTTSGGTTIQKSVDCTVSGVVLFDADDGPQPDAGAVVFLLPKQRRPEERGAGNLVSPDSFEPLENPGIDLVGRLGGAIVRTDEKGRFSVEVDGSRQGVDYFVLVVSKNVRLDSPTTMTKQQVGAIGTFFMPVDRVANDHPIYWSSLTAYIDKIELDPIRF